MLVLGASPSLSAEAAAPNVNAPLLAKDESARIEALITAFLKAGFPDAAKAEAYAGKLSVSAKFDPAKGAPPLPSSRSKMQMTDPDSSQTTYGYEFGGLHFKFPNGTWLISLAYRFKPGADDTVNTGDVHKLNLDELTGIAAKEKPAFSFGSSNSNSG